MTEQTALPILDIHGGHREMGQQVGETFGQQIRQMLATYRELISTSYDRLRLNWDRVILQARKYQPFVAEHTPQYLRELEGMAQGAGVTLDDLMVLNCMEGIVNDALHLKCTSFAAAAECTQDGHVLVAHNEDWSPEDEGTVYLLRAHPQDEPAYLALTYGGLLPNVGFNEAGLAQCCDSVYPDDSRLGVPRIFVARSVLACRTLSDALGGAVMDKRAAGYNHLLAHESGELYNLEASARRFAVHYAQDGLLAHTNHYLDPRLQAVEAQPEALLRSHVRFHRADRLLHTLAPHTLESFQQILADHVNRPRSICCHDVDNPVAIERSKTIASVIIDLTARSMYVARGNPCESTFHRFDLES